MTSKAANDDEVSAAGKIEPVTAGTKDAAAEQQEHQTAPGAEGEREKMLNKNGQPAEKEDVEKGGRKKTGFKKGNTAVANGGGDKVALLGSEELDKYRHDPFWRRLRIALFGGMALLFVALVVAAVLIVVFSAKCEDDVDLLPEIGEALPSNGTAIGDQEILRPSVLPRQQTVLSGEPATFRCDFPGPVKWLSVVDDNVQALPDGAVQLEDGVLKIGFATASNAGKFVCEAVGTDGSTANKVLRSEPVELHVYSAPSPDLTQQALHDDQPSDDDVPKPAVPGAVRPRVDSYLLVASVGDPVHFRCWQCQFASCRPSQKLHWHRVEGQNQQQNPLTVEHDDHSAFLIFRSAQEADAGVYECLDEANGMASSPVHLHVEPPRNPQIHPLEQKVLENFPAYMQCAVPGHTDAQLSWRLENGVDARRLPGVEDNGQGRLSIAAVREEHVRHGFVCWAVYPRRADKQALHAGPARIVLLKREELMKEEENNEEKKEKKEEEAKRPEEEGRKPVDDEARRREEADVPGRRPEEQRRDENKKKPEEEGRVTEGRVTDEKKPAEEKPENLLDEDDVDLLKKTKEMPEAPLAKKDEKPENEEEEGSGEALIQIEPLLYSIQAVGVKSNETLGGEAGPEDDEEKRAEDQQGTDEEEEIKKKSPWKRQGRRL